MSKKDVLIYISSNCQRNNRLLDQLDEWDINYEKKNVTENPEYMKELQGKGIFGTPVTFIDGEPILGMQKSKLKHALGIGKQSFGKN
ncbi:glutaredoxin family protein [Virgibacillus oceani]|uniref:Glutaredoxin domain-containing protein n=1 Tax=Virgibacillus oceani TaxID=1479511 RepID=A0A917HRC8_9BACI|nr:glutaredoxin family protein [Virgibacillus oceani]GGG87696.1 hypothetical protein GCM10011398_36980 [Virgibacillus oceani]